MSCVRLRAPFPTALLTVGESSKDITSSSLLIEKDILVVLEKGLDGVALSLHVGQFTRNVNGPRDGRREDDCEIERCHLHWELAVLLWTIRGGFWTYQVILGMLDDARQVENQELEGVVMLARNVFESLVHSLGFLPRD